MSGDYEGTWVDRVHENTCFEPPEALARTWTGIPYCTMPRRWLCVTFACFLFYGAYSHPVSSETGISTFSFTAKSEKSWLWGWAWGAESTVSVVDRTPVLSFPSRPGMTYTFGATSLFPNKSMQPPLVVKLTIRFWDMSYRFLHLRCHALQTVPSCPRNQITGVQIFVSLDPPRRQKPGLPLSKGANASL